MINKKYLIFLKFLNVQIEEHKIDIGTHRSKTKKYRIEGISTKSKGGTRYFNKENIKN